MEEKEHIAIQSNAALQKLGNKLYFGYTIYTILSMATIQREK